MSRGVGEHVFSAMERCPSFEPWHDQRTGKTSRRGRDGKCRHDSFYVLDPEFGLGYLRVPTWAPIRLRVYGNGHHWFAAQLRSAGIAFTQCDHACLAAADFARAQHLADAFPVERLHRRLDPAARQFCPVLSHFPTAYPRGWMQVEHATDIVFRPQAAGTRRHPQARRRSRRLTDSCAVCAQSD